MAGSPAITASNWRAAYAPWLAMSLLSAVSGGCTNWHSGESSQATRERSPGTESPISCATAKDKARNWYDAGGNCSFGHTCTVSGYTCKADPKAATVECRRENGFRFRWQMGE